MKPSGTTTIIGVGALAGALAFIGYELTKRKPTNPAPAPKPTTPTIPKPIPKSPAPKAPTPKPPPGPPDTAPLPGQIDPGFGGMGPDGGTAANPSGTHHAPAGAPDDGGGLLDWLGVP